MQLQMLKLLHFRNYDRLELNFHPRLNIFYGKNGSGKTNLVEAIYVLALTRSFRNVADSFLIEKDNTLSKIEGNICGFNSYVDNYRVILTKEGKKVKINQTKVTKLSDYIVKIPIVLFHPDDLKIIKDAPNTRRKQLNISISQYSIEYLKNLSIYNKLLKQRNAYLKQMMINSRQSSDYLDILTEKLVLYGKKIYDERMSFLSELNRYLPAFYERITGISGLKLVYKSDYDSMDLDALVRLYKKGLKKDLAFGKTNFGIHTDDMVFRLGTDDLKYYGSEGQQKNAIIAYKFCELEILKKKLGYYPILILDDLFSELDTEKIGNIFNFLKDEIQTFITTTELDFFRQFRMASCKCFEISSGKVVEEMEHES